MNIKLQLLSSIFNLLNLNLCHYLLPILLKVGGDGLFFNSKFLSSSTNNILLACVGYDNSPNVDNLQPLHESEGLGNIYFIVVDEQIVVVMHLEGLWKQKATWKPHYRNSPIWAFLKVNNNQPMDLSQN
jgi:hypothetical protein